MATTDGLKAAADTTKQIITLSTGIIALTVTFAKEFKPANTDLTVPASLEYAWLFFGLCLLFGVWTLMAITGSLSQVDMDGQARDANTSNIRIPSVLMILCFLVGVTLTILAGRTVVS